MKENIHWVDNIKLIGIFAVILGHMNSPFSSFIFSWHMPLFFMISGFFLKLNLAPIEFVKKDFKRLMIPYFVFSIFGLGVEILKRSLLHREPLPIFEELIGILTVNHETLKNHYGFVLWFLPALFLSRLIIYFLYRFRYQSHLLSAVIATILFALGLHFQLPFSIDHAMCAVLWVWLGYVLFPFYQKRTTTPWKAAFISLTLIFLFLLPVPDLNMADKFYGSVFLNIGFALLIISTMILFLKDLRVSLARDWSQETMLLFVFHPYTNNAAHILVEKINPTLWGVKLLLSLVFLKCLLVLKQKMGSRGIFKYV